MAYSKGTGNIKYSELLKEREEVENLKNSLSTLKTLYEKQSRLETELALYDEIEISENLTSSNGKLKEAKEEYEELNSEFKETYGNISSREDMDKALSDAETSLAKANNALEKQKRIQRHMMQYPVRQKEMHLIPSLQLSK